MCQAYRHRTTCRKKQVLLMNHCQSAVTLRIFFFQQREYSRVMIPSTTTVTIVFPFVRRTKGTCWIFNFKRGINFIFYSPSRQVLTKERFTRFYMYFLFYMRSERVPARYLDSAQNFENS